MGIKFASNQEVPQDCVSCQGLAYGFQFPGEKGSTDPGKFLLFVAFLMGKSVFHGVPSHVERKWECKKISFSSL